MPPASKSAPANVMEGFRNIATAVQEAMTAPDAGQHMPLLEQMFKATIGQIQKLSNPAAGQAAGGGAPPGAAGPPGAGGPPGMGGGGTNLQQLMGGGAQPPSAGPSGGPSSSGASADDLRRILATTGAGAAT